MGFKMCGKTPKDGTCKAKAPGVYAMKTEVDVYWRDELNSPELYDAGRGKIEIYFKGELSGICEDGSGGVGTITACGDSVPPILVSANCGIIQIVFPEDMWDKPTMPKFTTTGSTTGFNPGDTLSIAEAVGLLGIDLSDPNAAWPTYDQTTMFTCSNGQMGKACFPDHDGDGNPGITVKLQQDGTPGKQAYDCAAGPWAYVPAPTSIGGAVFGMGAIETYIGLRTRIGGSGKIGADCMSGTGPATAEAFESRLFDCKTTTGACSATDSTFVDKNLPNYHVLQAGESPGMKDAAWMSDIKTGTDTSASKGPLSAVVRVADLGTPVTCAQIRATQFPAFQ